MIEGVAKVEKFKLSVLAVCSKLNEKEKDLDLRFILLACRIISNN